MITTAIIPVAGWGTRRLPITKSIEKAMLPVGNRPLVDYVVEDCVKAGIRDIYFVVSEGSTQLRSYYEHNGALETYLIANGKEQALSLIQPPQVRFHYVEQPNSGKYGTAVPISLVVPQLPRGESAVVLMGDDFIYNADGSSEVVRLLGATPENGNGMLAAQVHPQAVSHYGVLQLNENNDFVRIVEKPQPQQAPSNFINISKYVFNYDLLSEIARYAELTISGEYMVTEPINQYVIGGGSVRVIPAVGRYLDGGTVEGWLHANRVVLGE